MLGQKEEISENLKTCLVSAVITTHNRKDMLKRAIESVLAQTYPNMELIVVSDASTDGTDEMCSGRDDLRYITIPKEESRGGNYARNLGIRAARGEYVAFLDDDDAWLPTKIEKQIKLIEEKECGCVYCLRMMETMRDGIVVKCYKENLLYKSEGDLSKKIFRYAFTSTSCLLVSKNILDEIGGFDENLFKIQEYELLIRISQLTNIYYCHNEPLVIYTSNDTDKSRISNDPARLPIAKEYVEKKHSELLKNAGFYNRFLHYDWMYTALYRSACRSNNTYVMLKYSAYYYISYPIRKFISLIYKMR